MRSKILLAALFLALGAGVAASTSAAGSDPGPNVGVTPLLRILPAPQLQFGAVPIGKIVIKPVVVVNGTQRVLRYAGANPGWPNFDYPAGAAPFPKGFWEVDPSNPYGNTAPFSCWEIAPQGRCTLHFGWLPYEKGTYSAQFGIKYTDGVATYTSNVITLIGTGY